MSLTPAAYRERKWGQFPVLRRALEDKKVPEHYYGLTSASDNMFDGLHRLLEIAVLVQEYDEHIREVGRLVGEAGMYKDLKNLESDLKSACLFFGKTIEHVQGLADRIGTRFM
jgi:hypothetical protein